jgi:type I restriction enzyme R subunit
MLFYAAFLAEKFNNPTIVVITDRNDLDEQLYRTFSKSEDLLRQTPKQADVRKLTDERKSQQVKENTREINGLYDLLNNRESGRIIFTTIQKFKLEGDEMPVLTDRRNVIIIADEAHRSQYGLEAKTDTKTGKVKYGYAKYLRDALPNGTGFDVPSLHTMYIDKLMKGHNLIQAISRVNRVFKDKTGGVIVDYLDILESLKKP